MTATPDYVSAPPSERTPRVLIAIAGVRRTRLPTRDPTEFYAEVRGRAPEDQLRPPPPPLSIHLGRFFLPLCTYVVGTEACESIPCFISPHSLYTAHSVERVPPGLNRCAHHQASNVGADGTMGYRGSMDKERSIDEQVRRWMDPQLGLSPASYAQERFDPHRMLPSGASIDRI